MGMGCPRTQKGLFGHEEGQRAAGFRARAVPRRPVAAGHLDGPLLPRGRGEPCGGPELIRQAEGPLLSRNLAVVGSGGRRGEGEDPRPVDVGLGRDRQRPMRGPRFVGHAGAVDVRGVIATEEGPVVLRRHADRLWGRGDVVPRDPPSPRRAAGELDVRAEESDQRGVLGLQAPPAAVVRSVAAQRVRGPSGCLDQVSRRLLQSQAPRSLKRTSATSACTISWDGLYRPPPGTPGRA